MGSNAELKMVTGISLLAPTVKRLENKVAVITGGASGIGASTARLFVSHGAKVVIADVQDNLGRSLCKEIGSEEAISFVHCDVSSDIDVQNAVDSAIAKYGKLDIIFSNAGIKGNSDRGIVSFDCENLKRVLDVNVFGAFLCAKHAARVMIPAKKGCIIFNSSLSCVSAGLAPNAYAVSKHALLGLTKNLCVELGKSGIRVNCISPGAIVTAIGTGTAGIAENQKVEQVISEAAILKGAALEVEDVAEAALYLGSDEAKYVSGLNLVLDGGYSTTNPVLGEGLKKLFS